MNPWITSVVGAMLCVVVIVLARAWRIERQRYKRVESARAQSENALRSSMVANNERDVTQQLELAHLARVAMVGELSSALTHELNQPLTAILSNAQAAQRMLHADIINRREVYDLLNDIVSEDKRVGAVIERLRTFLTRDATRTSCVDVSELVREVLALAHSGFIASRITATAHLGPGVPLILADRVQIQQVLLNLILNATSAMVANDVYERRLTVATTSADDGSVLVSVTDTGPRSVKADSSSLDALSTSKESGFGRGLDISKTIIDAHGGRIWAVNNPGPGATFCFTLPSAAKRSRTSQTSGVAHGLAALCLLTLSVMQVANGQSGWGFLKNAPAGQFTDKDVAMLEEALQSVLDSDEVPVSQRWENPESGNSGELRVLRAFKSEQGRSCKRVQMDNESRSKKGSSHISLCQDAGGKWLVDPSARPVKDPQRVG